MISHRIFERPSFQVIGKKTWISGPDNQLFGQFWKQCAAQGVLDGLAQVRGQGCGLLTGGQTLGISDVSQDPAKRDFYYWIAVENPLGTPVEGLEQMTVPASLWAAFECRGQVPDSIVRAEMFAFKEWLPASGYVHALAPEMEVYFPGENSAETVCEFWLPIRSSR